MRNGDWLVTLIEDWFYSDLEIQFALRRDPDEGTIADSIHGIKDKKIILCTLVSNVYYDHTKRGSSPRYEGSGRWFIVIVGDDCLYEEIKEYCGVLYDKARMIDLIEGLDEDYTIFDAETFEDNWYKESHPFCGECGQVLTEENMWSEYTCKTCAEKLDLLEDNGEHS